MKELRKHWWLVAGLALFMGCASGPKYSQVSNMIPPVGPEQGRIFFYRASALGAAVQPSVMLNGETIGTAQPDGFFYVDRPPGNYQVSTTTEVKRTLSLLLEKEQVRYVRLNISMGFFVGHVYPELVEPGVGEKQIQGCSYIGRRLPKP